jgi:hypothetical protein
MHIPSIRLSRNRSILRYPLICGWLLLGSCSPPGSTGDIGSQDTDPETDTDDVCRTGDSQVCPCDDGQQGEQLCTDGDFSDCECPDPQPPGCLLLEEWASHGTDWECVYLAREAVIVPFTLELDRLGECAIKVLELETWVQAEEIKEVRPGPEVIVELGDEYACYLPGQTDSRGRGVACNEIDVCQEDLICRSERCLPLGTPGDTCAAHEECEDGLYCFDGCRECSTPECPERLPGCVNDVDQRPECLDCITSQIRNEICEDEYFQLTECRSGCSGHPNFADCFQDNCSHLNSNYNSCENSGQATARQRCLQE